MKTVVTHTSDKPWPSPGNSELIVSYETVFSQLRSKGSKMIVALVGLLVFGILFSSFFSFSFDFYKTHII